ncbi:hypothetical protein ED21_21064 [Erythrobacter sp. SD-21]|nr:hypothetical protein ED21_21064 [Erythrobacter sp. SD-21]
MTVQETTKGTHALRQRPFLMLMIGNQISGKSAPAQPHSGVDANAYFR